MTQIYIIRHAEAEGNLYRRLHGQYDSLVTETGKAQIAALRRRFERVPVDACYASDLIRTRMTAQAVCGPKHLKLQPDPRFREIRMGVWEDVPFGEVAEREKYLLDRFNEDPAHWYVSGAERYEAYTERFLDAMTEAAEAHAGQTIAIFSHGSVIRGVLMRLFYGADHPEQTGHCDNTGVTLLEYEAGQYRLVYKNDNSHLPEEISTLAKQSWWRQDGKTVDHNLWYRPVGEDAEIYLQFRQEAWHSIYGNLDGYQPAAFWCDAKRCAEERPEAVAFAMLGEQIVGLVQLDLERKAAQRAGYISFYYMRPAYQNLGLGVQMLGHCISICRPMGRTGLQLSVSPRNTRALRFYSRYGFEAIGKTAGAHGDLTLMEKSIDRSPYLLHAQQTSLD